MDAKTETKRDHKKSEGKKSDTDKEKSPHTSHKHEGKDKESSTKKGDTKKSTGASTTETKKKSSRHHHSSKKVEGEEGCDEGFIPEMEMMDAMDIAGAMASLIDAGFYNEFDDDFNDADLN